MYSKLEITGIIEVQTGLHIGGSSAFAAIGAVDSPVIRDTVSDRPMIPGSSLKGKIRSLLAREYNADPFVDNPNKDDPRILRMFGSSQDPIRRSRLLFRDTVLSEAAMKNLEEIGIYGATEVKFENTINRLTAKANPRQIERVIRGVDFELNILYNAFEANDIEEDIEILSHGLKLLEYDYLGGNGSRGYGKVKFKELKIEPVIGDVTQEVIDKCRQRLAEV